MFTLLHIFIGKADIQGDQILTFLLPKGCKSRGSCSEEQGKGLETQPRSLCGCQGPKSWRNHLLPPHGHISRKLELDAAPRGWHRGVVGKAAKETLHITPGLWDQLKLQVFLIQKICSIKKGSILS